MYKKIKILLLFFCGLILLFSSFQPAFAIEYGGIGGRPAFPRTDNPRSESIFIHEITPNRVIDEGIKVINNTQEIKNLIIYATDETPSTDGGFACEQLSEPIDAVGGWIHLEKNEVTLEPLTSEVVPFTITAPENVDVGEHNGCIVIQEKKEQSDKVGLNLSFRTGIRVALTIPGEIVRLLEIVDFKVVDKNADIYILIPTIKNGGNTSIDTNIKVTVVNTLTKEIKEFGGKYSVLRNNPLVLNFDFKKPFWGGMYSAKTTVIYNDGSSEKTLESQTIKFISIPKKQALIYISLVILLLLIVTITIIILRKKRNKKIKSWQDYTVKEDDTFAKIVKEHSASWKEVVSVNKLKPPYELKTGEKIKVPPVNK